MQIVTGQRQGFECDSAPSRMRLATTLQREVLGTAMGRAGPRTQEPECILPYAPPVMCAFVQCAPVNSSSRGIEVTAFAGDAAPLLRDLRERP
jgi:hypothetical protein